MPKVTFMRHARTDRNEIGQFAGKADCNTTEEGLKKARENFPYSEEDFDYYICSPLKRTMQTLNAVIPGQEPIIDDRIIERDLGEWEDEYHSNIPQALIQSYVKGYYDPPKSEPYTAVTKRVKEFLEDLYNNYNEDDRILVITHAGILRQIRDNLLPNMKKEAIDNAATLTVTNKEFEEFIQRLEKEREETQEL